MKPPKKSHELLDMYYLDIRSHLLEAAAGLDRIARADDFDNTKNDPRMQKLFAALDILKTEDNKAKAFLDLFSE